MKGRQQLRNQNMIKILTFLTVSLILHKNLFKEEVITEEIEEAIEVVTEAIMIEVEVDLIEVMLTSSAVEAFRIEVEEEAEMIIINQEMIIITSLVKSQIIMIRVLMKVRN